ncbi:MAG: 30S ribosomal protein S16 [Deltaproteobacteria bacterium]|nr:MAG: 30S ribosomal protein S16 [Deltaproteobacteria bacterium]
MVKVRLARHGSKKRPYYHIVVTDSEKARDGRFIEQIGTYDPAKPPAEARIDHERLAYWTGVGAKATESLGRVIREHKKALDAALAATA